jgi:O-antigen ligase
MTKFLNTKNINFILFLTFPISILVGNFAINLNILIISLNFIYYILKNNIKNIFKDKDFFLLFFFFLSLLVNLIFTNDINLSYPRVIKVFFIIFFIFSFKQLLADFNKNQVEIIYKTWTIIFVIIILDLIIEYFSGENVIGFKSIMPGARLASFTGTESVIGNYFYGFVLITLSFFQYNFKKYKYLNIVLAIFFIIVSFIIGERANFIKTFIIVTLFTLFIYDIKFKIKIFLISLIIFLIITLINSNEKLRSRYIGQISLIFETGRISSYLENSQYGAHYNVAYEIFRENPFFGVGIKNFRIESSKDKYDSLSHPKNDRRSATHPHQIHYEFLSETGLFGYFSFLIFIFLSLYWSIKNYLINKNIYQISSIFFILTSLLPLLPSGSFLSSYTSAIFWLNYSIMVGYNKTTS